MEGLEVLVDEAFLPYALRKSRGAGEEQANTGRKNYPVALFITRGDAIRTALQSRRGIRIPPYQYGQPCEIIWTLCRTPRANPHSENESSLPGILESAAL